MTQAKFTVIPVSKRRAFWIGGQHQAVIVGGPETGDRYALSHSTIARGGGALEHQHSREAEAFYVIAGTLRFAIGGQTVTLAKGDFLHAEPGQKYSFEALEPSEVLILYAPAGLERFIAESGIADADGYQRSIDEAGGVLAAAPAYGVNYTAVPGSK
ncbi:MAG TPA: cupin domain-containing protein [Reyranella sp.]|nr:cupin domain-containing protein [Reyranella sp.]